jgi:hypothetical protein
MYKTLMVLVLVAGTCSLAFAQTPAIVEFDPPGSVSTVPNGINFSGTISGYYVDAQFGLHGFVRDSAGNITSFDAPGAASGVGLGTFPIGINDLGQIVGYYNPSSAPSNYQGFMRDSSGVFSVINVQGRKYTQPFVINNAGQVAGCAAENVQCNDFGSKDRAFVMNSSGSISSFAAINSVTTNPLGINAVGTITGTYIDAQNEFHGFVRVASGQITEFDVPSSVGTRPQSINDKGLIAGFYIDASNRYRGFIRVAAGNITVFDGPGTNTETFVTQINSGGVITGYFSDSSANHAFFRNSFGKVTSFDAPGADLQFGTFGMAINSARQITGYYLDTSNVAHGFLLQ